MTVVASSHGAAAFEFGTRVIIDSPIGLKKDPFFRAQG